MRVHGPEAIRATKHGVGFWAGLASRSSTDVRYALELHVELDGGGGTGMLGAGHRRELLLTPPGHGTEATLPTRLQTACWKYAKRFPALEDCVHFISHSLGCVPAKAKDDLNEFFDLWRTKSITAWSDWLPEVDRRRRAHREDHLGAAWHGGDEPERVDDLERARVVLRLHARAQQGRLRGAAVPDVSYVWQAEQRRGAKCVLVPSQDGQTIDTDAMCAAIDEHTLLVPMSHVVYSSAYIQDAKNLRAPRRQSAAQ